MAHADSGKVKASFIVGGLLMLVGAILFFSGIDRLPKELARKSNALGQKLAVSGQVVCGIVFMVGGAYIGRTNEQTQRREAMETSLGRREDGESSEREVVVYGAETSLYQAGNQRRKWPVALLKCPGCQQMNIEAAKFCGCCGSRLDEAA